LISGPLASPANDGIANLLKYAFGLEAKLPASPDFLPIMSSDGPQFLHRERSGANDIFYHAEASTDLLDWSVPVEETQRQGIGDGWFSVTSAATVPVGTQPLFYRMRVSTRSN